MQNLSGKTEKFYFDKNIFDEEEEEEELVPEDLPPVFSEEELALSKDRSFQEGLEKGRREGFEESQKSLKKKTDETLSALARDIKTLLQNECRREKIYEEESVRLCLKALEKLFPYWVEERGLEEIKRTLTKILMDHKEPGKMNLDVHPDVADAIRSHIQKIEKANDLENRCQVKPNDALTPGACRISWDNGGAVKNINKMAETIFDTMKSFLPAEAPEESPEESPIGHDTPAQICENSAQEDRKDDDHHAGAELCSPIKEDVALRPETGDENDER